MRREHHGPAALIGCAAAIMTALLLAWAALSEDFWQEVVKGVQ